MKLLTLVLSLLLFGCINAQEDYYYPYKIRHLKEGKFLTDTSFIYALPFEPGKKYRLVQAYESSYSHKGERSLDFKMKTGTPVHAAREGIVTSVKSDSDSGGQGDEFLSRGNHIVVLHKDSTYAGYWHLQLKGALVSVGDTIRKGQLIGYSGNTGYSAFPHLHFYVYYKNKKGQKVTIPTRFYTNKGIRYLRPGRRYKTPNAR